jgi:hypothetical protein
VSLGDYLESCRFEQLACRGAEPHVVVHDQHAIRHVAIVAARSLSGLMACPEAGSGRTLSLPQGRHPRHIERLPGRSGPPATQEGRDDAQH